MKWVLIGVIAVVALAAAVFFLRRALGRGRDRAEKRRQLRDEIRQIRSTLDEFEKAKELDDQIRLLADITRYASTSFRLFPDHPEIMN
ncbi:MAG: hypothetical protein ACRD5I_02075, partial [Candidatus Acidiferrales bacterium]